MLNKKRYGPLHNKSSSTNYSCEIKVQINNINVF